MPSTCCVLGLGYIGLPTAAVLSGAGYRVIGVDVNAEVVDTVNKGKIHIVEPDLDQAEAAAALGTLKLSWCLSRLMCFDRRSYSLPQRGGWYTRIQHWLCVGGCPGDCSGASPRQPGAARVHLPGGHYTAGRGRACSGVRLRA